MYAVEVPGVINFIKKSFYRLGFWDRENSATVEGTRLKLCFSIYYFVFPISLLVGAFATNDEDEFIFLLELTTSAIVLSVKLFYLIWRKRELLALIDRICVFRTDDKEQFTAADTKLQSFNKIAKILISIICFNCFFIAIITPFLGSERKLFFNIAFPLDRKNGGFGFWLAFTFLSFEIFISDIAFMFSVFTWYLMIYCDLNYEMLGHRLINLGACNEVKKREILQVEKGYFFRRDLTNAIQSFAAIKQ